MKIKKHSQNEKLFIYIIATLAFLIPVLTYGADSKAFLGFALGTGIICVMRKKLFPILCYFFIIMCNIFMSYVPLGVGNITVMGVIKIVFMAYFVILLLQTRLFKRYIRNKQIGIYFLWCLLSVFVFIINAVFFDSSLLGMLWRLVPIYFSMAIVVETARNKESINEIMIALIAAAIIFSLVGYLELIQGKTFFYSTWTGAERYRHGILRVGSTLEDANILGLFLLPPIFLLYTNKMQDMIGKAFSRILAILMIVLLITTNSRSSLIALTAGIIAIFLNDKRSLKQIFALIAVFIGIISTPLVIKSLTTFEAASAGQRFYLMGRAFTYWMANPIFGIGLSEFEKQTTWLTMCEYMRQLCEVGIFAFVLYCAFYVFHIVVFKRNKNKLNFIEKHDASCVLGYLIAFMINSGSLDTYYYYIMWVIPALMMCSLRPIGNIDNRQKPII